MRAEWELSIIHCVPQKRSHFYFLNNSVKNEPILIIFGTLNPKGTLEGCKFAHLTHILLYLGMSKSHFQQWLVETWAGLQQSVVDEAIDQWQKWLGACVHAQGDHFEHSLLHYFHLFCHTQHNRFFSEPPTFFKENNVLSNLWTTLLFARYCVTFSQVRWANLQSTSVKFLQDAVCQKSLKSVNIWPSY